MNERKIKLQTICRVPSDGTRRERLCRVTNTDTQRSLHFAECHLCSTRQRITAVRHPDGRRTAGACWARDLSLPSARLPALDKGSVCRVPFFADGQHSAKCGHAVCHMFAECPRSGTRQRSSLPSARDLALDKPVDTRYLCVFR